MMIDWWWWWLIHSIHSFDCSTEVRTVLVSKNIIFWFDLISRLIWPNNHLDYLFLEISHTVLYHSQSESQKWGTDRRRWSHSIKQIRKSDWQNKDFICKSRFSLGMARQVADLLFPFVCVCLCVGAFQEIQRWFWKSSFVYTAYFNS